MTDNDWFSTRLSSLEDWFSKRMSDLQNDYKKVQAGNLESWVAAEKRHDDKIAKRDDLIRDLCRALERAQEIIVELGERSGNAEALKDAKVYANVIGGLVTGMGPQPANNYMDDPVIKKHWAKVVAQHEENKKELAKRKRRKK